jgi:hypothetical protein
MSKTARSAAAEHEADRLAVQDPGEARYVIGVVAADVTNQVYRQIIAPLMGRGLTWAAGPVMQQDEIERPAPILPEFL